MSAGDIMQGRRVYPDAEGKLPVLEPGDYGKSGEQWFWRVPRARVPSGPSSHSITEHEDGTITVAGSIGHGPGGVSGTSGYTWHGMLERGVWREV
jgi:hypothetical protein